MTALENMAAAARPPGIGDARVPCPLCGGLVHPVAGRCKHCKEDLATYRQGRPQAAAALPSLNGHAVAAASVPVPIATPIAIPSAREGSAPILPQRPTGRSMAAQRPSGGLLRNWPMIVIGVAVLAIITAVVIMVLPEDKARSKRLGNPPPPAPDRMDSSPIPPKASQIDPQGDPWDQPSSPPSLAPVPDPNPPQPQIIPDDPVDPNDPFAGMGGLGGTGGAGVMFAMAEHACTKMKSCPSADQAMLTLACDQLKSFPKVPMPTGCAAAKRCLDAIDSMDCSQASSSNPLQAIYLFKDCTSAMTDC